MADSKQVDQVRFDISASVVFRLGEELITDTVQALVELVKNSYDADATWAKIRVDTRAKNDEGEKFKGANGVIIIADDGDGMTRETITHGWLTIANSPKRESKRAGRVSRRGRTPIGDKGLGRLGVQRLASNVEIITRPKTGNDEFYVAFSWSDFEKAANLSDVEVTFIPRARAKGASPGTTLILSDLKDVDSWRGEERARELQRSISSMISPFQEVRDFTAHLELEGKQIELAELAQRVRETALLRYQFRFDGKKLRVFGKARLAYLQPDKKDARTLLASLIASDEGKALFEFLSRKAKKQRPQVFRRSTDEKWFVEFETEKDLADLDGVKTHKNLVATPGPFHGEIDAVSLDRADVSSHAIDDHSEYRRIVGDLAGVRVYRDGFGIRVGEDWLGLGKQWTSATSYYGLRPRNVLGFVALSAKDNAQLEETTSREGFLVTPYYENFFGLMKEFVDFAGNVQEFLRRGTLAFLEENRDASIGVKSEDGQDEITRRVNEVASVLAAGKARLEGSRTKLLPAAKSASRRMQDVRRELGARVGRDQSVKAALESLEAALDEMEKTLSEVDEAMSDVNVALGKADELKGLHDVVERRWDALRSEVAAMYESVSLGLTAEVLSHEIHNVADALARRSSALSRELQDGKAKQASVVTFIEHVRTSIVAMRKQLSHLSPSLRYVRDKREVMALGAVLKDVEAFYRDRLAPKKISIGIEVSHDFAIRSSRGKLVQVLDNLLLNSEYWLVEDIRLEKIKEGRINIVIAKPRLQVFDNGRGVDPTVEDTLFEPFVTTKRKEHGRGLGLFVVQQLLGSEGCSARLLPERNSHKRRFKFELDLTGALHG